MDICSEYIDKYISKSDDVSTLFMRTCELHSNTKVRFNCRHPGCDKVYVYHSGRVNKCSDLCSL